MPTQQQPVYYPGYAPAPVHVNHDGRKYAAAVVLIIIGIGMIVLTAFADNPITKFFTDNIFGSDFTLVKIIGAGIAGTGMLIGGYTFYRSTKDDAP